MTTNQHLTQLETSGLIRLAETVPELEYLFRHALVQDAAYTSLLHQDRKRLHLAVGETLESMYPDRLDELAPLLGHHFALADDDLRALRYFTLAGDTAAAVYANAEAAHHYTRALEIAQRSRIGSEELTHLYTRLGRVLELNSRFDEALVNYVEMETLAHQRDDRAMALAALMPRITLHAAPTALHDSARALALGEEAIALARDLGDRAGEAKVLWSMSLAHLFGNRGVEAIDCGERSLVLARELDLREQMAFTLNDLGGLCYLYSGRLDQAQASLHEASALWRELGNLPMLVDSLGGVCTAHVYAGAYDQALAASAEALQISQSIDNLWGQSYSLWKVGLVHWDHGEVDRAIAVMEESVRLGELAGFVPPQAHTRGELALLYGDLGDAARGLETVQPALPLAETQLRSSQGFLLGIVAHLHLLNDDLAKAEEAISKGKDDPYQESWPALFVLLTSAEAKLALQRGDYERALAVTDGLLADLRQWGMRSQSPQALYLQAQALLGLGQAATARERLLEARTVAEAIGSQRILWQILALLAQIAAASGQAKDAAQLQVQAREIIEFISDNISDPELRTLFLRTEPVLGVLQETNKPREKESHQ